MSLDPKDPFFEGALRQIINDELNQSPTAAYVRKLQGQVLPTPPTWQTATLQTPWVPVDIAGAPAAASTVGFFKDTDGFVHLRGTIAGPTSVVAMYLPVEYRPEQDDTYPCAVSNSGVSGGVEYGLINVFAANGGVLPYFASGGTSVGLTGVTFYGV